METTYMLFLAFMNFTLQCPQSMPVFGSLTMPMSPMPILSHRRIESPPFDIFCPVHKSKGEITWWSYFKATNGEAYCETSINSICFPKEFVKDGKLYLQLPQQRSDVKLGLIRTFSFPRVDVSTHMDGNSFFSIFLADSFTSWHIGVSFPSPPPREAWRSGLSVEHSETRNNRGELILCCYIAMLYRSMIVSLSSQMVSKSFSLSFSPDVGKLQSRIHHKAIILYILRCTMSVNNLNSGGQYSLIIEFNFQRSYSEFHRECTWWNVSSPSSPESS